nr:hypothetical protein [Lysinibacillus sphaericus]
MQLKFDKYVFEGTPVEIAEFINKKQLIDQCKTQQLVPQTGNTKGQSIGSGVKKD